MRLHIYLRVIAQREKQLGKHQLLLVCVVCLFVCLCVCLRLRSLEINRETYKDRGFKLPTRLLLVLSGCFLFHYHKNQPSFVMKWLLQLKD